jgi:tryptophanyl-tRNA synthetase
MTKDKIIFSGIQPSGELHIGHYIGTIEQWLDLQRNNSCYFSIVDYHAITVDQNPDDLRKRIFEIAKLYLALGINPEKSIIFQQSDVSAHTELAWILSCQGAYMADLNKMTQFKDKAGDKQEAVSAGLFTYPVLMAADILLYDTQVVPVGEDQKQHVELARDIAKRFNNKYGPIFTIPEALVKKEGARVMSLNDPFKKMSKSEKNSNSYIALLDSPELARSKIMKAVTDSGSGVYYLPKEKPAISNLLSIYAFLGNREIKRLERDYLNSGYGDFKKDLAEVVVEFLGKFQERYKQIKDSEVYDILELGKEQAKEKADLKLKKVKDLIGLINN